MAFAKKLQVDYIFVKEHTLKGAWMLGCRASIAKRIAPKEDFLCFENSHTADYTLLIRPTRVLDCIDKAFFVI